MDDKQRVRARVLAARDTLPADERERRGIALARHGVAAWSSADSVAAYGAVGTEPPTAALIEGLRAAGVRVLLPVVDADGLDWAAYDGPTNLVTGSFGLLEPAGPRLGATAILHAKIVIVPALALDRAGHRLGRGRGYYDRALVGAAGLIVGVVYDEELVDDLPVAPHDQDVHAALTPAGLVTLRN